MTNTRYYTVKGTINYYFSSPSGSVVNTLEGIEIHLWHKAPMEIIFLGKGITNSNGEYHIEFEISSPNLNIVDRKISDVFIKAYYNDELLSPLKFDPDAQLYFDQLLPQPSDEFKEAVNALVIELKANEIWAKLDRFWIFACEEKHHARVSSVNPESTRITEINAPTWTVDQGYTGDGVSSYLVSNYNMLNSSIQYTQNSGSMGIYVRNNLAINAGDMGVCSNGSTGAGAFLNIRTGSNTFNYNLNSADGVPGATNTDSRGFYVSVRTGSSAQAGFKNGAFVHSNSNASTTIANLDCYIMAMNQNSVPQGFTQRQIALSFIGSGTIDQTALYTTIQNFATTRGFNV